MKTSKVIAIVVLLGIVLLSATGCGSSSSSSYTKKNNSLNEAQKWVKDNYNIGSDGTLYGK